ncbi:D-alanine--D-alanine ligase [Patescibacteria group bacterium]|nr:D-alanine--D-alanine ligase [Patescibacteria group bacterium]
MPSNNQKTRVAVLFGGRSGEHEVSLVSAASIIENLDKKKYEITPIKITKQGKGLIEHNFKQIDVVFPVLHGSYGEDGTVQGFLELTGLPYVGCSTLASSICMDKVMQKKVLESENIQQTPYVWFWTKDWEARKDKILDDLSLIYPVFVKPANTGSSVGISKAKDRGELINAAEEALRYDRKIIIEQGVEDPREIEVAILGNQKPKASVPGEIIPSNEFYDYDAKYVDGKSDIKIPADLDDKLIKQIQQTAIHAYKALNCEGMARVDFLLAKDGTLYLNELNTIPGFTSISMYPKLWEASGLSYSKLLDELIQLAMQRTQEKSKLKVSYQPKVDWYNN